MLRVRSSGLHQGSALSPFLFAVIMERLRRKGMKVSRSKTDYLCINEENGNETVKMEDTTVTRVKKFKYLGSTVQKSGGCER